MKELKVYNQNTCLCDRARIKLTPYIRVKKRNYYIAISREVYPLLGIDPESDEELRIEFLNDPQRPGDWYIRRSENGLHVRRTNQNRRYLSNKALVLAILSSCSEPDRLTFLVAREPVEEGSDIHALLWRKGEKVILRY